MTTFLKSKTPAILLSLIALACVVCGPLPAFAWLSPVMPWLPMALAAIAIVLLMRVAGPRPRWAIAASALVLVASVVLVPVSGEGDARFNRRWRAHDSRVLIATLHAVGDRVMDLQLLSTSMGENVETFMRGSATDPDATGRRVELFRHLEDAAARAQAGGGLPSGTQIGLQLFDSVGRRIAWAGWPQALSSVDTQFLQSGKTLIYTRQVSLYQILRHMIPLRDEGGKWLATLLVDMPLEVNYKVNNNFLKSGSFVDNVAGGMTADIRFDYQPTDPNLPTQLDRHRRALDVRGKQLERRQARTPTRKQLADSLLAYSEFPVELRTMGNIRGDESSGLAASVLVHSTLGNPLMTVTAVGRPYRFYVTNLQRRFSLAASLLAILAVAIYFVLLFGALSRRRSILWALARALSIVVFVTFLRYLLLWLEPLFVGNQWKVFDPAIFATPFLGGLMRSAGDLLLTAVFFFIGVYAVMRTMRDALPSPDTRPPAWLFVVKGVAAAAVLVGAYAMVSRFIGAVVVNANPRLIGDAMRLIESYAALLHVSIFLMTSGILLAAIVLVWGIYRLRGRDDNTRSSVVAAIAIVTFALLAWHWEVALVVLLLLVFATIVPKIARREDIVSFVTIAFWFVINTSAAAYVLLNEDYQALRRTFIQEKVEELTHPADNWKVFILEDVLEKLSQDQAVKKALADPTGRDQQSLAFNLWAESSLSYLGYSSAVHVFNAEDSLVSRFMVEMPYRVPFTDGRQETATDQEWVVLDLTTSTEAGSVRFYRGIVNIGGYPTPGAEGSHGLGKIVVDIPFFFESLSWAARTGPQTPQVLRNVQEGGITPRVEEPEALLLARLDGMRVRETSSDVLPVGYALTADQIDAARALEWPLMTTPGGSYRYLVSETDTPDVFLLAGFPVPDVLQHVLRWSTVLSLYFVFTVVILVITVLLGTVPAIGRLLPSLAPGRQLGFQQKILGSFLLIALLPSIVLGVFAVRLIKERFVQESRNEALAKSLNAQKALAGFLVDEMTYIIDHSDLRDIMSGQLPQYFTQDPSRRMTVLHDRSTGGAATAEATKLITRFGPEELFLRWSVGRPYLSILSNPVSVSMDDERQTFIILYERRLDSQLLGRLADQLGADINIYAGGDLVASSREGLLFGGFISSTMNAEAFVNVSLMDVDRSIATESAGNYRYEVAYVALPSVTEGENAAIGVPLLFRPESFHVEVQKATSIVLSIFALLSALTIGVGLLLTRGIFEPLKRLLEGTRRISMGDLSVRLEARRPDEVGTVMEAFNEMTDKLEASRDALEERRRYLEIILASIGTGVISTDANDYVRTVNDAAQRILGVEQSRIIDRPGGELAQSDIAPEFFVLLSGGAGDDKPFVSAEISIRRDESPRTIKYMKTRLTTDGRYVGTVYVFEDLTELISSKKLSAWVEMARQIAHEIKNPLTPIKLSTQFMVKAHREKAEDFDTIFDESAGTIMQQVDVLRRIASEFSSFGRMQAMDVESYAIVPQLEEIVGPYVKNTSGVDIALHCGDREVTALANREAVRKICTNLIENAMEAMPEGGRLDVTCDTAALNGNSLVRISFRDSGPGLSDEVKENLFEPYFSTKTTGTGLGLAICRRLSREMGGDVVLTNLDAGTGVEAALYLKPS